MKKLGHVPALDGIRGIAIAAVVGYHFMGLPGGFFGVDLFFVLSGFLITTLLLEEHDRTGRISFRGFYVRRARRLLPALFAMLSVSAALAIAVFARGDSKNGWFIVKGIAATALYCANVFRMLGHTLPIELTPMWTLAQEEQFYFIWPLVFVLFFHGRSRRLAIILAVVAVAIAAWRTGLVLSGGPTGRVYFGPDTRFDGLVLGAAIAVARYAGAFTFLRHLRVGTVLTVVALAGFAATTLTLHGSTTVAYVAGFPAVNVAAGVLIVAAVEMRATLLAWRPLAWLGSISYGLYVWQATVVTFFGRGPIQIVVAVAVGWWSTRTIEARWRRRGARLERDVSPSATTGFTAVPETRVSAPEASA